MGTKMKKQTYKKHRDPEPNKNTGTWTKSQQREKRGGKHILLDTIPFYWTQKLTHLTAAGHRSVRPWAEEPSSKLWRYEIPKRQNDQPFSSGLCCSNTINNHNFLFGCVNSEICFNGLTLHCLPWSFKKFIFFVFVLWPVSGRISGTSISLKWRLLSAKGTTE